MSMHKLTAAGLSQSLALDSPPEAKSRIAATMIVSKRDLMKSGFQRDDRRPHLPIFRAGLIDDHLAGEYDGRVPRRIDLEFINAIYRGTEISVVRYGERLFQIDALVRKLIEEDRTRLAALSVGLAGRARTGNDKLVCYALLCLDAFDRRAHPVTYDGRGVDRAFSSRRRDHDRLDRYRLAILKRDLDRPFIKRGPFIRRKSVGRVMNAYPDHRLDLDRNFLVLSHDISQSSRLRDPVIYILFIEIWKMCTES